VNDLVKRLVAGGGWVEMRNGKPFFMGTISDDLKSEIRADRDGFLDAWDRYSKDRYNVAPPEDIELSESPPGWRSSDYSRVDGYVRRQVDEVNQWVLRRFDRYRAAYTAWDITQCTQSALRDLLYWQLGRYQKPEELLATFEWVAKGGAR